MSFVSYSSGFERSKSKGAMRYMASGELLSTHAGKECHRLGMDIGLPSFIDAGAMPLAIGALQLWLM